MAINHNQYLFQNRSGLWVFQIFVPKYMRHVFGHKRAWRKSTGTKDIVKARQFRNHLLIEFNKLKEKLKPDTEEKRISGAIASLYQEVSANNEIEDRRGKPAEVKTTSPTLCEIRDEYSENYKNRRSYSTLSKSARAVEVFLATIRETDIKIDIIGRRMVTQFIRTQQERVAGQTLQNWLTCLGSLYEFALRTYDAIPEGNPFHNHNLEARRTIESYEPFELVQMQKLLDAAEPEIKNIIVMGLFSGCRLDELASLKKSEIQTVEGVRCFYISKSKTKAGIRHVPIHSRLSAIVDEYLSHSYGEYLFPQANKINRADGKKGPFYSQAFTRLRRRVLPTATDRQCFHSLRGMFITCLDRAGVPEQRIGAITGHTEQKAKTEAFRTYSKGAGMKELSEHVELVDYEFRP
ncbi:TPA: tyrosine-type recombinase/integrase [Klebsiella pneumoniae]|jgi:integrase|uniref:tyrosine-type recombinase/integrase n=1 Tax=Enterobacteriaceae TaxID=543 RepID=UPI000470EA4C|nr:MULTISPECIES: tyrosine-type recombinase/integrase [Enterobacteriaceae]HDU5094007.1 tyrosine-type recombinase/integrase [Klebsiella pneumoniae subsp. ozaenae]HDW3837124.1 tyrosine-type recombinase/integrase [Raoultella ornithinolytica]EFN5884190.1 tyrosine-type recombinase/integrase [Escherichia coli]EKX2984460.1 tyrosine-type recombinase/integrase [Klebsiella pneumoniae]KAA8865671.1 tyrosine-type recombinase/integrase [Klebsiella pneumoniae]